MGRLSNTATWLGERWTFLLGLALLATGLITLNTLVDVDDIVSAARGWVASLGVWGPIAYGGAYVVATLLFFPGTPFTVLAAFLFDPWVAFAVMVGATTVSAVAGFFIARRLAKATFERRLGDTELFGRLRRMVEHNRWFAIPFVRLLPIFPFAFNNYALGLTNISFWSYMLWSQVVFVPMNAVFVFGATAIYRAMVRGEASWDLIIGSTIAGLVVLGLGLLAKRWAAGDHVQEEER